MHNVNEMLAIQLMVLWPVPDMPTVQTACVGVDHTGTPVCYTQISWQLCAGGLESRGVIGGLWLLNSNKCSPHFYHHRAEIDYRQIDWICVCISSPTARTATLAKGFPITTRSIKANLINLAS